MARKSKQQTKRYSQPRRKSARKDNLYPKPGFKKTAMRISLEAFQIAELKKLAKEHGTTLAQEFDNAIDAYVLGASQGEIRTLNALVDQLKESTARANKALDAALRETGKTRAHVTRKKRAKRRA